MAFPAPNLDDRRFQDLVDDAKRLVQQRCPEWTDHNVSDPGVTLIETFAYMVDQLLYRVNRIPERHYMRFLDLVGLQLHPPSAAETDVTFWLSQPQPTDVVIPVGTEVSTTRTPGEDPLVFTVVERREIVACSAVAVFKRWGDGGFDDVTARLTQVQPGFGAFQPEPEVDDELLIGLDTAVGGCALQLTIDAEIEGVGVDPTNPPLRWEAWDGDRWTRCELERDTTGGFNRDGEVVLHIPRSHAVAALRQQRAGWIRCRVVRSAERQPGYSQSPFIRSLEARTIGGTTRTVHAELHRDEVVGTSAGVPAQRFPLLARPLVPADGPRVVRVGTDDIGWVEWTEVDDFSLSGPDDLHVVIDPVAGELLFGPAVREPDGTLRQYGAVPAKGSSVQVVEYRAGGGSVGNVSAGAVRELRTAIPYIATATNRSAAAGGVDAETVEQATVRAPIFLRTRGRAVTFEDYEELALEASPEVGRVRCIPAGSAEDSTVRVLIVPELAGAPTDRRFEQLIPTERTLKRVASHLEARRVIGARVRVQPAVYQGVTVVVEVIAAPGVAGRQLQDRVLAAIAAYVDPKVGGPARRGWPFGRPLQIGEVFAVAQAVSGVDVVADVRLFPADPISGKRGEQVSRVAVDADTLLFGFDHQVRVVAETGD